MARANSIQFGAEFRITVDDDAPREMRKQIRTVNQILGETLPAQEKAAREQEVFAMRQKLVTAEFEKGTITAQHYAEALAYLESNLSSNVEAAQRAQEAARKLADEDARHEAAITRLNQTLRAAEPEYVRHERELKQLAQDTKDLTIAYERGAMDVGEYVAKQRLLESQLSRNVEAARKAETEAKQLAAAEAEAARLAEVEAKRIADAQQKERDAIKATAAALLRDSMPAHMRDEQEKRDLAKVTAELNRQIKEEGRSEKEVAAALALATSRLTANVNAAKQAAEADKQLAAAEKLAADNAKRLAHEQQQATDAMKADVQNAFQQVPFIGRFTAALGPATAGLAAVGAAAAVVAAEVAVMKAAFDLGSKAVWSAFEAMDATSDSAEKLGMSATALSKLQVMAELAEVPTESLTSGIQKLEVAIGDAMAGSEESAKKFAALGLNFEELAALAPQDQFEAVAKKISAMGTQGEKLNAVFDIFGRGNTELVKMVSNYDAVKQEAEASGNVMTQAMTDIANAADKDFRALKESVAGLSKILAKEVLPAMGDMAKELTKLAKDENVRTLLVGTFQKAATAIQAIAEATKFWGEQTKAVTTSFSYLSDILNSKSFMLLSNYLGAGLLPRSAMFLGSLLPGTSGTDEAKRTMELDKRQSDLQNSLLEIEEKKTAELRSQLPLAKQMIEAQEKQAQLQQEGIAKRQDILDQLHGEIETMGMSREQLEQRRLAEEAIADTTIKDLGAVLDVIDAQAQELENLQAIRTLKEQNAQVDKERINQGEADKEDAKNEAKRLKETLKTEEEITAERHARWKFLKDEGLLTDEQVQQLIAKNTPTEKMKEAVAEEMPKTIRAGSAEAFRMAFGNRKPRTETLLEAIARNTDPKNNQTLEVVNAGLN